MHSKNLKYVSSYVLHQAKPLIYVNRVCKSNPQGLDLFILSFRIHSLALAGNYWPMSWPPRCVLAKVPSLCVPIFCCLVTSLSCYLVTVKIICKDANILLLSAERTGSVCLPFFFFFLHDASKPCMSRKWMKLLWMRISLDWIVRSRSYAQTRHLCCLPQILWHNALNKG